ncbi:hypothetical protein [Mycolicibacterium arenosum]|uniref:Uncharacterized protein n=1 Tax=Mycolicibacterium arenosum TaxID=2952157 RepID=A0ABT1M4J2_9MYCO|nr:hypothetical protein [Mycolicibacterium sp. CAU 1645]MCP9274075.1 hypothetical protein [Mycolicibacterium sp. CAU 1645]
MWSAERQRRLKIHRLNDFVPVVISSTFKPASAATENNRVAGVGPRTNGTSNHTALNGSKFSTCANSSDCHSATRGKD